MHSLACTAHHEAGHSVVSYRLGFYTRNTGRRSKRSRRSCSMKRRYVPRTSTTSAMPSSSAATTGGHGSRNSECATLPGEAGPPGQGRREPSQLKTMSSGTPSHDLLRP